MSAPTNFAASEDILFDGSSLFLSEGGTINEGVQGGPSRSAGAPSSVPPPHPHQLLLQLDELFSEEEGRSPLNSRPLSLVSLASPVAPPPTPTMAPLVSLPLPPLPQMALPSLVSPANLLAKAGCFSLALEKLENLSQATEKIKVEWVEGGSITRHLRLPTEIEKLQKLLEGITKEEFGSLDDAAERKIVVATRWTTVVKTITDLCYAVKGLAKAHPLRSKLMKKDMIRVLEALGKVTENARQAVEWFIERDVFVAGKATSKGAHLVSQIGRVLEEWREV